MLNFFVGGDEVQVFEIFRLIAPINFLIILVCVLRKIWIIVVKVDRSAILVVTELRHRLVLSLSICLERIKTWSIKVDSRRLLHNHCKFFLDKFNFW